ncbi:GNAT family N-acetyltransferase [Paenibacillus sp. 481]|uniref:GNAT family N-acetyltransferase n=1 Tax=Paenibacillus sp. 481 TaxID=2835869 RepID=UPI001E35A698|nr:GNAT family protein [Paenibacillus sp. 481]UHA72219.1 GNAT family N-acetyltransferase [Paenibacillus sp. 481]
MLSNKQRVRLKPIQPEDLQPLYDLIYGDPTPAWKQWDAPYFPLEIIPFSQFEEHFYKKQVNPVDPLDWMLIEVDNQIIGTVSYYWEHKPSNWLEVGIVIYQPTYWSNGYGTEALRIWIDDLFQKMSLARVGLTTWSGNERMMKAAEKLGMQLEGRMRKCRIHNGQHYDSIRMGVLREEWQAHWDESV